MPTIKRYEKTKILHRIVENAGVLYLAGVVANDTTGDMEEQTRQICRQIDRLLEGAGSSRKNLLSATIFITDMAAKEAMNRAWLGWLDEDDLPARATIGIASLGAPETLVEIVVTAAA